MCRTSRVGIGGGLPTISQGEKCGGAVTPPAQGKTDVLRVKARADARSLRGLKHSPVRAPGSFGLAGRRR